MQTVPPPLRRLVNGEGEPSGSGDGSEAQTGRSGLVWEEPPGQHRHCQWVLTAPLSYPKKARWGEKGAGLGGEGTQRTSALLTPQSWPRVSQLGTRSRRGRLTEPCQWRPSLDPRPGPTPRVIFSPHPGGRQSADPHRG